RKSSSELNKSLGGHIASEKLQECLQELIDLGKISKQTEQTAGRPRTTFFLPEKDRKEDKS
ncbi:MAG: hypothetical protein LBR82_05695, partial [Desulfovibrio sp.]|nr:hypothetical protein [Desulfovibrio sp.]MDR1685922.1 hypothetical protein [Desulfovibrio sp.]